MAPIKRGEEIRRSQLRDPNWFQENLDEVMRQHAAGTIIDDRPERARRVVRATVNQHPGIGHPVRIDVTGQAPSPDPTASTEPAGPPRAGGSDFNSGP